MNAVSQALVEHEPTQVSPVIPTSDAGAIFQIIERAARDPSVDIEKMKELMAMRKAMQAEASELEYDQAMSAAQEEMQPIRADANNPSTKSRYASYAALDGAIRSIYTKHGFSLSFDTGDGAPEGCIRVVCRVAHRAGHRERPKLDMPADGKGAKGGDVMTKTHATGAAVTYGKRYLLGMIFNLAVGKDDDGNSATVKADSGPISQEQSAKVRALIEEVGADIVKFCNYMNVEAIPDIKVADFPRAIAMLEKKKVAK